MATETGGKPYSSGPHFDWENYFCAMSRVWKRVAKKWRKKVIEDRYFDMWIYARTDADRRLELLKKIEPHLERCPICLQLLWVGEHDGWCELAKELKCDENSHEQGEG